MNVLERAQAHGEHMTALTRYAAGYGPIPEPSPELASAIVRGYCLLLHENEQMHLELGLARNAVRLLALDEACPALERWRALILKSPRRSVLEKAAAWELTALVCEENGDRYGAEAARENAADVIPPTGEVAA